MRFLLKFYMYLLSVAIYLVSWNWWWKVLHLLHSFFLSQLKVSNLAEFVPVLFSYPMSSAGHIYSIVDE